MYSAGDTAPARIATGLGGPPDDRYGVVEMQNCLQPDRERTSGEQNKKK